MDVLFPARQFACPVHGSIEASDLESLVVDSAVFQRLRRVKQLGNTHYVFPGATHTRFSHSLGVMHLAGQLFDALLPSWSSEIPREVREACSRLRARVRLAGLTHDVGHGPYSHHFENMLLTQGRCGPRHIRYDEWDAPEFKLPTAWIRPDKRAAFGADALAHEHFTYGLVRILGQWLRATHGRLARGFDAQGICSLLDDRIAPSASLRADENLLAHWLKGTAPTPAEESSLHRCLKSILSSDIDADRMDYLQRDSLHCGVRLALDLRHLFSSVSLRWSGPLGRFVVLVRPNAVGAIEQILIARKQMFNQVYQHRVTAAFDELLRVAMRYWMEETGRAAPRTLGEFLALADEDVLRELCKLIVDARVEGETPERLALKMFVTRTPPVARDEREVAQTEVSRLRADLMRIHGDLGEVDIVTTRLKDFFRTDREATDHARDVLFVSAGRDRDALAPVVLRLYSEILQSTAWREARMRVLVNEPLMESARRRHLAARLALLAPPEPAKTSRQPPSKTKPMTRLKTGEKARAKAKQVKNRLAKETSRGGRPRSPEATSASAPAKAPGSGMPREPQRPSSPRGGRRRA
jgi:HD superfamily phosphohydrolase